VLVELKINMLLCSPGMLMALAEMSTVYGVEVPEDLNVKVLLTTGEMLSDGMAGLLAQTWDATVYNFMYGSQEAACPGVTRTDGSVAVIEPTYLLEVLDIDTEESLGFEGFGELCLTMLVPGLKPLIRYRTGDLCEITAEPGGGRSVKVLGRVKDMTVIGGRRRGAAEIDNTILADPEFIYGYEIEVSAEGGEDKMLVRIKAKEGADQEGIKKLVAARVTDAFGVRAEARIHPLLDLKSSTGGWVSWKTARIKDLRVTETDNIEVRSADSLARAIEDAI
jgi:phenylacetate-CoA ligase